MSYQSAQLAHDAQHPDDQPPRPKRTKAISLDAAASNLRAADKLIAKLDAKRGAA